MALVRFDIYLLQNYRKKDGLYMFDCVLVSVYVRADVCVCVHV